MADGNSHHAVVTGWLAATASDAPAEQLLGRFEAGFDALWRRAQLTLGHVTLVAIVDRVLCNAAERIPLVSLLEVDDSGLRFEVFRPRIGELSREQLAEAAATIMAEFLTVLGQLTAEIMTPGLHAALSGVERDTAS